MKIEQMCRQLLAVACRDNLCGPVDYTSEELPMHPADQLAGMAQLLAQLLEDARDGYIMADTDAAWELPATRRTGGGG